MSILNAYINLMPVTLMQGVIYAFVALGIMIPFRLLSFPDLTVEGSFPLGGCVAAALIAAGVDPWLATGRDCCRLRRRGWRPRDPSDLAAEHAAVRHPGAYDAVQHQHPHHGQTEHCAVRLCDLVRQLARRIMSRFAAARIALRCRSLAACRDCTAVVFQDRDRHGVARRRRKPEHGAGAGHFGRALYAARARARRRTVRRCRGAMLAQNQAFADVNMGFGVLVNGLASVIVGEQLIGRGS